MDVTQTLNVVQFITFVHWVLTITMGPSVSWRTYTVISSFIGLANTTITTWIKLARLSWAVISSWRCLSNCRCKSDARCTCRWSWEVKINWVVWCLRYGIANARILFKILWKSSLFFEELWVYYLLKESRIWFRLNLVNIVNEGSLEIVGKRQKIESENGCFKKTKHAKFSEITNICYSLTRTGSPFCLITEEI